MKPWAARAGLIAAAVVVVTLFSAAYTVQESQQALVQRFGQPIAVQTQPGLWFKWPFIDTVTFYDMRLLALEPAAEPIILGDQKRVEVDTYTQFRIVDPLRFNQTVLTLDQARSQLAQSVNTSLRRVLGQVALPALMSTQREAIVGDVKRTVAEAGARLGIEVVDVRIRRADLPPETSQAIYDRMKSERQREAKELRAQGFEWAQEIQARADRERAVILAEAELKARTARTAGDAEASQLFTDAFGRDPGFFAFYRAMQTYRHALAASSPTLVLSPGSALLRYFNGPALAAAPEPGKP